MKVVVLAGGESSERDVSLASGSLIANALARNGHEVLLVDLLKGIEDCDFEKCFSNEQKEYNFKINESEPKVLNRKKPIGKNVLKACKMADKVFIALHGGIGENGKLQEALDLAGIKYTGTRSKGSMIAMNKILSKEILERENINTARWTEYNEQSNYKDLKFPLVVKPASNGSSVGVSIVKNEKELKDAITECKKYKDKILIEEYIEGREFSVGVLKGKALMPIEIIPKDGFYDYKNKYQEGKAKEVCPPNLQKEKIEEIKEIALKVHKALELGSYSRVDFIMNRKQVFYVLEANTLPGMTKTSLLPQEAKAEGISYEELCEKILEDF